MFRSGTTLLAKLLNSHKDITISSDAFFSVFKFSRNKFFKIKEYHRPFSDYVYDKKDLKDFKRFQKFNLKNMDFNENLNDLRKKVYYDIEKFSPEILDKKFLKNKPKKYSDILKDIFFNLKKKDTKIVGIKEVWITEFIPILEKIDKSFKHIIIIRDPRAVVSSNFASRETYPIVFLLKQWKKIFNLSILYKKKFKNKILIIKYEDLISSSRRELSRITNFLNIKNNNLNKKIGSLSWFQNSSYNSREKKFNLKSINKWKQILSMLEKKFIEKFCFFEMEHLNYKKEHINKFNYHKDIKIPKCRKMQAKWLKNFISNKKMNKNFLNIERKKTNDLKIKKFSSNLYLDKSIFLFYSKIFDNIYK